MPSRKDRFGYDVTIPATTARVVDTAVEILGDPDPDEMAFLHSVLAQTFLPYRDPKTRDYLRENGRASLVLTAGYLLDPQTRKPVLQGVPYGTKPRLLLIHLCTQAIRLRSPVPPASPHWSGRRSPFRPQPDPAGSVSQQKTRSGDSPEPGLCRNVAG